MANAALALITRTDGGAQAQRQYDDATNMTQQLAALSCLLQAGKGEAAVAQFYDQWRDDRLVIDKWFMMQIVNAEPEQAATVAGQLTPSRHGNATTARGRL